MNRLISKEEKGLQDVKVFWVCESDAVAAYSLEEAKEYYMDLTGLPEDDLYTDDDVKVEDMEYQVHESEDKDSGMITVKEIISRYWEGRPFIAITTGGF